MSWLYWLSQITPSEQFLVGEKIFILSQLLQGGNPILPGFALGNSLLTEFLTNLSNSHSQSWLDDFSASLSKIDINDYQALQSLVQQSQRIIMEREFPKLWQEAILDAIAKLNCSHVIIRPSLLVSHYQQKVSQELLRSQICDISSDAVIWGIKRVWSELFTAKSIFYWHELGIEIAQIKLALLIQPMQDSQASGTIDLDKNHVHIRAIWGLGHGLKYGAIEPDIYLLDRQTSHLIKQQLGAKIIYYHLNKSLVNFKVGEDYLVADTVKESLQQTAVMNNDNIRTLMKLVEKIISTNPESGHLKWSVTYLDQENISHTGFDNEEHLSSDAWEESHVYFHQSDFITNTNQVINSSDPEPAEVLLTGTGAAPGQMTGQVFIYNSEKSKHQSVSRQHYNPIVSGSILVTNNISLLDLPLLKNIGGIITETGSLTSHAAILARELGIPAIVNSKNATTILETGKYVTVDGDRGTVFSSDLVSNLEADTQITSKNNIASSEIFDYPIGTKLMVNISQDNMLDDIASLPIDGLGLLRAELMLLDLLDQQTLEQWVQDITPEQIINYLVNTIKKFTTKFSPRPVFYRTISISFSQLPFTNADIPNPSFFDLELAAIARLIEEGVSNINLVLPFVRNVEEFIFYRDRFLAQGLANTNSCQLWIMAEVPAVIFLLSEFIKAGVQGFMIGTGDLTRLLFGLEREQIDLNQYYNAPAFKKAIAQIISLTKDQEIPCSICLHDREINSDLIDNLIRWGITNINVEPQAIAHVYRSISRAEQRLLLEKITDSSSDD